MENTFIGIAERLAQERKQNRLIGIVIVSIVLLIICIVCLSCNVQPARAELSYPTNLWKGLIAEDVSGGYQGMYAVACCVRNRLNMGMNTGLMALKRRRLDEFVRREGRSAELIAKDIVKKVFEQSAPDITRGATHYEAVETYGMPKWARSMVRTVKIGKHTFFKFKQ
ncbi:MAG: cell wall hydrolase [Candidatus Omnitrophica bacterium]|nr:cell wall hydrolase [Candidatus Omnitrophota bacterium]